MLSFTIVPIFVNIHSSTSPLHGEQASFNESEVNPNPVENPVEINPNPIKVFPDSVNILPGPVKVKPNASEVLPDHLPESKVTEA